MKCLLILRADAVAHRLEEGRDQADVEGAISIAVVSQREDAGE